MCNLDEMLDCFVLFCLLTCSVDKHWDKLPKEAVELRRVSGLDWRSFCVSLFEPCCEQGFMLDKDSYSKVLPNLNHTVAW